MYDIRNEVIEGNGVLSADTGVRDCNSERMRNQFRAECIKSQALCEPENKMNSRPFQRETRRWLKMTR
jgi:hypothetical protein